MPNRTRHWLAEGKTSLLECLSGTFGLTRAEAEWLISFGAVYVDRERVDADCLLTPGQYVRAHLEPRRYPAEAINWRSRIVHEEEAFVVVNKPAGVPVHATLDNRIENVLHQLGLALGAPVLITQRLDQDVAGLMVLAKTREFQKEFNRLLLERKTAKRYRALVTPAPPPGRHVHYMKPSDRAPRVVSVAREEGWRECALKVVSVEPAGPERFDVVIDLETGRTHQIRTQLAALGNPVVGDALYGSKVPFNVNGMLFPGIALCSVELAWSDQRFMLSPPWSS